MEFSEEQLTQFLSAINFSAHKHRNQRRKGADAFPYINHPIMVAEMLWRVGEVRDMPTLIAALLHDTIEDTDAQPEEIEAFFGREVLLLVQECTDDKSLPKAERKRLQILNAPHKSAAAKQIKLADKISNVSDVAESPPAHWDWQRRADYLSWAENVVAGLRGANRQLEAYFDEVIEKARRQLQEEGRTLIVG